MVEVQESQVFLLTAPYIVNEVDDTIADSAVWLVDPSLATVTIVNGVAEFKAVAGVRADVEVVYTALGIDAAGKEVDLHGVETFHIVDDVVIVPPRETVEVAIVSTLKA